MAGRRRVGGGEGVKGICVNGEQYKGQTEEEKERNA